MKCEKCKKYRAVAYRNMQHLCRSCFTHYEKTPKYCKDCMKFILNEENSTFDWHRFKKCRCSANRETRLDKLKRKFKQNGRR